MPSAILKNALDGEDKGNRKPGQAVIWVAKPSILQYGKERQ